MAISQQQMAEIARILGFPNLSPMSSLQVQYPYFSSQLALWQPYAMLINRLSQAAPYDEVQYLGGESTLFGSFFTPSSAQLTASTPSAVATGVIAQLNVDGIVTPYTTVAGDTPTSVIAELATLMLENPALTSNFMVNPTGPIMGLYYIAALGTDGNGINCIATSSDPSLVFSFGAPVPAKFAFGATSGGAVPPGPQYTPIGSTETTFGYVPIIHVLESDLINSRVNLDTKKADVWEPRQDELGVRYALLHHYRKELADRLSVPMDPDIAGNANRLTQRIV